MVTVAHVEQVIQIEGHSSAVFELCSEEGVAGKFVQDRPSGVQEFQTAAKEVDEVDGEAILDDLHISDDLADIDRVFLQFLLSIGPLDEVELGMQQTADVVPFDYPLPLLTQNYLQYLLQAVRLLVSLEPSNGTFQHNES